YTIDQIYIIYFTFFFSSRRRHTRFSRDWSSDVCSSDLDVHAGGDCVFHQRHHLLLVHVDAATQNSPRVKQALLCLGKTLRGADRSEERRVGKGCRSRWS